VDDVNIGALCYNPLMKLAYHHGNLKESLVVTTLEMIEKEGVERVTLRELTKRLGTSRSAVYRHFESKEALLQEVIFAGFAMLEDAIAPILMQRQHSVIKRFSLMGRAYVEFALAHPAIYRMIFGHELQREREEKCDMQDQTQATGFHALIALLQEGQEAGVFKKEDPMLQAAVVWSMVHGVSNLLIDGHLMIQDNIEAIFEMGTRTLIEGIRA